MFCYQDGKLYLMQNDTLVGVDVTPTGISTNDVKSEYKNGRIMTTHEVKCAFGIYRGLSYKFPVEQKKTNTTRRKSAVI